MLKTYTLYLRGDGCGAASFEPVMCETMAELLEKAREVLARHPQCGAVEVYFGDAELFQVKQDRTVASDR